MGTHIFLTMQIRGMHLNIACVSLAFVMCHYRQSNILHQLLKLLIPRHEICLAVHLKHGYILVDIEWFIMDN